MLINPRGLEKANYRRLPAFLHGETVVHSDGDVRVKALSNMRYERALDAYEQGGTRWWWSNPG
jgi:hypothetical protein